MVGQHTHILCAVLFTETGDTVFALSPITADVLHGLQKRLEGVCAIDGPTRAAGTSIDFEQLSAEERRAVDDGAAPTGWLNWWVTAAREIEAFDGAALITLEPGVLGKRHVQRLESAALAEWFDHRVWSIPAGVVLAWGVPADAMNRAHWKPVACSGAIGVDGDGYIAILIAEPGAISSWPW